MSEKTKITESLLNLLGFDKLEQVTNTIYYINTETDMIVVFGDANIPVIKRQLTSGDKYIGGYEYYEDALEAFNKVVMPQLITDDKLDLSSLRSTCEEYIDIVVNDKYGREDAQHYIYEEAMKAIYGKNIFDFINKHSN